MKAVLEVIHVHACICSRLFYSSMPNGNRCIWIIAQFFLSEGLSGLSNSIAKYSTAEPPSHPLSILNASSQTGVYKLAI